jgi:hypothetical protein
MYVATLQFKEIFLCTLIAYFYSVFYNLVIRNNYLLYIHISSPLMWNTWIWCHPHHFPQQSSIKYINVHEKQNCNDSRKPLPTSSSF